MDSVKCDNCEVVFTIDKIKSKCVGLYKYNDVRFQYFNCPKCKKKYFVGIGEKEYNKMIAKLKQLQKKNRLLIGSGDADAIEKLQSEMMALQAKIKARRELLKQLFVLK